MQESSMANTVLVQPRVLLKKFSLELNEKFDPEEQARDCLPIVLTLPCLALSTMKLQLMNDKNLRCPCAPSRNDES